MYIGENRILVTKLSGILKKMDADITKCILDIYHLIYLGIVIWQFFVSEPFELER